jgi:cation diffusion facilitator family transporter
MIWGSTHLTPRDWAVIRVFWIVLFLNLAVAGAKLVIGLMTNRITILADAFHSFLDGANNLIGIVALGAAAAPPDAEHPYGHRKFENIAAMLIGGVICLVSWQVLSLVVTRVWEVARGKGPELSGVVEFDALFIGVITIALMVNYAVSWWERGEGIRLQSPLLRADAGHTASDCYVTLLSLGSLMIGQLAWWIDPLLAVGVLVFLVRAAWGIISENLAAFTDRAQLDPAAVGRVAEAVEGVMGTYGIRSHGMENDIHLDLSIVVAGHLTAEQAEDIEKQVRVRLREAFPGITLVAVHHRSRPKE